MLRSEQFLVLAACGLLVAAGVIFSKPARAAGELRRGPAASLLAAPRADAAPAARRRSPTKSAAAPARGPAMPRPARAPGTAHDARGGAS